MRATTTTTTTKIVSPMRAISRISARMTTGKPVGRRSGTCRLKWGRAEQNSTSTTAHFICMHESCPGYYETSKQGKKKRRKTNKPNFSFKLELFYFNFF